MQPPGCGRRLSFSFLQLAAQPERLPMSPPRLPLPSVFRVANRSRLLLGLAAVAAALANFLLATADGTTRGTPTVVGALIGLLLGLALAYALSLHRRRFDRLTEPEFIYHAPLVAAVPAADAPPWSASGLPVLTEPLEASAEAYRMIATALRSLRGQAPSLLVAISAATTGAGTTAVVANTGLALIEMGERVLVIDGDPIGRGLTRTLTDTLRNTAMADARFGFSEFVGGCALLDAIVPADVNQRLGVMPSGLDPDLAVHRWSQQAISLAFTDVKNHFDVVLVDVPPIGTSSYGLDLTAASDHLMLVVPRHDEIAPHLEIPDRLRFTRTPTVGYVMTGSDATLSHATYFPVLHNRDTHVAPPRDSPMSQVTRGSGRDRLSPAPFSLHRSEHSGDPASSGGSTSAEWPGPK
jgi:Mrp family chromosome partitioning ATPase